MSHQDNTMQDAASDGLNFLPLLSKTPPVSSRSRAVPRSNMHNNNLNCNRLGPCCEYVPPEQSDVHDRLVYYNGNYEGDSSMFEAKRITDSDSDFEKDLIEYEKSIYLKKNHVKRLWDYLTNRLITEQVVRYCFKIRDSFIYFKFMEFLRILFLVAKYLLITTSQFCNWSYGLWKSRSILRATSRRLLWWMTLARCGDTTLFAFIMAASPVLFMIAAIGLILALYCKVKELVDVAIKFLQFRLMGM